MFSPFLLLLALPSLSSAAPVYDNLTLHNPAPPSPPLPSTIAWNIPPRSDQDLADIGLPVGRQLSGNFLGFSIESSVSDQVIAGNDGLMKMQLLHHLRNIQQRAGAGPRIRWGGNSQEGSTLYPEGLESGDLIDKDTSRTKTPLIDYDLTLFYAMSNISALTATEWFIGLSFADATNQENVVVVMQEAKRILGDNLSAFQLGNEPDLYAGSAARRPAPYEIDDYQREFEAALSNIDALTQSTLEEEDRTKYLGPSVCCTWSPDDMDAAGYLEKFGSQLKAWTVEHYPQHNCDLNPTNTIKTPEETQDLFSTYLTHNGPLDYVQQYISTANKATDMGLDVFMLEFNTASCSGFPGLSTSFGAALWIADAALALASRKFSTVLIHVGGRSGFYNPFTAPPGGQPDKPNWTTGSPYYPTLVLAEALGKSNQSQVVDLTGGVLGNVTNEQAPAYAIYENGVATRVVLINYVSDPSGANDFTATLTGQSSEKVYVRYLTAVNGVAEQEQIYWANQTLGKSWESTGQLWGDVSTVEIPCNEDGTCSIPVYAPSLAVVYLSEEALRNSTPDPAEAAVGGSGNEEFGSESPSGSSSSGGGREGEESSASASLKLGWTLGSSLLSLGLGSLLA